MALAGPGGFKADIMAKAPKPGDEMSVDAELLGSVDSSAPRSPMVLTEPDRAEPQADMAAPDVPEAEMTLLQTTAPDMTDAEMSQRDTPVVGSVAQAPRRDTLPPPAARQSIFLPLVLGGALAAVGGFAASHYNLLKLTPPGASTAALEATVADQSVQIAALTAEVERMAASLAPDTGLAEKLSVLEQEVAALRAAPVPEAATVDLAPLTARLQEMESQLAAIAALPAGDGTGVAPAALAALQTEVAALKSVGGAQSAEMTRLAAEAEARITEAEVRAAALSDSIAANSKAAASLSALGRLQAALETGAPFETALANLGEGEVPAVLQEAATTGLPTLTDLADSFPEASRSALEAALRANMGESWTERVSTFLRTQTGARSLTPREGDDPDAILSRAEAALGAGDVAGALTETRSLPEVGLAAMSGWIALAEQRLAAESAVADLVSRLGN